MAATRTMLQRKHRTAPAPARPTAATTAAPASSTALATARTHANPPTPSPWAIVVSCGYAPIVAIVADHEDWPAPGWFGGTITRDASLVSPQQCQDLCAATADCDYFSYEWELTAGEMYHECYLKEAYTDPMCMSAPGTTNPYVPWGSQDSAWHGHSSVERSSLPVSLPWKTFLTFFCCTAAPRCARAPAPPRLQRPAARRRRPRARPSQASRPRCSHWPPFTRSRRSCTDREMK